MSAVRIAHEADPAFCKDLSDNRERYVQQSKQTRNGQVAPLPPRMVNKRLYAALLFAGVTPLRRKG